MTRFKKEIASAIKYFWSSRSSQKKANDTEHNNRGAVLGGKQMDGFVDALARVAASAGVPQDCIITKGNYVPGYFRSSKNWDMLIISPKGKLIALVEFKSQIGSYGNNFNNRTEEAIGSSVDFWTAFRENQFPNQQAPWVGYFMLVGKDAASTTPVRNQVSHFDVLPEFENASYIDRYRILCRKLVLERNYTSVALMWTSSATAFGDVADDLSVEHFLSSFESYLKGVAHEFK